MGPIAEDILVWMLKKMITDQVIENSKEAVIGYLVQFEAEHPDKLLEFAVELAAKVLDVTIP